MEMTHQDAVNLCSAFEQMNESVRQLTCTLDEAIRAFAEFGAALKEANEPDTP